jgi:hypothetical protein
MWWKFSLILIAGVLVGLAISIISFRHTYAHLIEQRAQEMAPWSSVNKNWGEFSVFLRYGGRESLRGAAQLATEIGMSEPEVRGLFGPPDQVAVGAAELMRYPGIYTKGRAGAYFYKVGPCVMAPRPYCGLFVIVFDATGKVIDRHNLGVAADEQLANFHNDTRSDRLIAP